MWSGATTVLVAGFVYLAGILPTLLFAAAFGLVFGLFVGSEYLVAALRGRSEPPFDWFEGTPWSRRTTPRKRVAIRVLTIFAGVFIALAALAAVLLLVALLTQGLAGGW